MWARGRGRGTCESMVELGDGRESVSGLRGGDPEGKEGRRKPRGRTLHLSFRGLLGIGRKDARGVALEDAKPRLAGRAEGALWIGSLVIGGGDGEGVRECGSKFL